DGPDVWRRSVYAYVKRNMKYPMFEVFDQPNASLSCERREVTTVPTQALTLFNNDTFLLQAQHLAGRVEREAGQQQPAQIKLLYRIMFSREPLAKELQRGLDFLKKESARPNSSMTPLSELAHVLLNSNEFVYIN